MKAMIFAAGLGTRLKPLTDTMPKAMVPVCGKPLLWHVLTKIRAAGFDDITVNVHHFASQIVDFLDDFSSNSHATNDCCGDFASNSHATNDCWSQNSSNSQIHVSDETDLLRETGGGIRHARQFLDGTEPFLVHNVDILSNLDLTAFAKAHLDRRNGTICPGDGTDHSGDGTDLSGNGAICPGDGRAPLATLVVSERATSRYLLFDDDMRLVGWTNVKTGEVRTPFENLDVEACRKLAFSGIHLMSPEVFPLMENPATLGQEAVPEKFSIIDFYLAVAAEHPIYGYIPADFKMLDVGKIDSLAEAEKFIG